MPAMTKIERVQAVINKCPPDRPPISFWHHFRTDQRAGRPAVDAHLKHLKTYDLDFLKVFYDLGYPNSQPIQSAAQLRDLPTLTGDEEPFAQHYETLRTLAGELNGRVLMSTTIFNAWATLRRLLRTGPYVPGAGPSPADTPPTQRVEQLLAEDRGAVAHALDVISVSLAVFARRCLEAGADGIFLSVRDDWVDTPANGPGTYDQLVRHTDRRILGAAADASFNMLHVCGWPKNFDAFAQYPVQVINWADRLAGPPIAQVAATLGPAPCAGIDQQETLTGPSQQACVDELRDALAQAAGRPIIIGPGCTFDPHRVPRAHLTAVRRAVDDL